MHPSIALKRLLFLMNERAGHSGKTLLNTIKVTITNKDLLFHISDYNNNLSRGNSINFRGEYINAGDVIHLIKIG